MAKPGKSKAEPALGVQTSTDESINQGTTPEANRKKNALDFRKYTKQIWLAGLGAFSRAEDEGNRLFDSLVKVGEELEAKTTDIADNTAGVVGEVKDRVTERVTGTKERVERALDERVNSTVARIGFASHKEVAQLVELIERLDQKIDQLTEEVRQLRQKK
ncbi:phasin family protein [Alkanindiges sp. WGS2144]|uniref:phasin family protein n=1 Tax=Alkanindiges sp. WGS2144 TaxID=3366808 RepID=UPI003752BA48